MAAARVLVSGASGAGKTTALLTLCGNALTSPAAGIDFGQIELADGTPLQIATLSVPGDLEPTWSSLTDGAIGLVMLIDNSRPNPLADLRLQVKTFREFIEQTALVIGITKTDIRAAPAIEDYFQELKPLGLAGTPVFEVDVRQQSESRMLLEALLFSVTQWSEK